MRKSLSAQATQLLKKIPSTKGFYKQYLIRKYNGITEKLGSFISLNAHFEDAPTFPHGLLGIFISNGASIGKGCTIFHQVTIGSNTFSDSKKPGAPTIGDDVFIGAGAKIIGGVRIGNHVRIGANCVITQDIPDNCTVVLPSSRIILHEEGRSNRFRTWGEYRSEKKD